MAVGDVTPIEFISADDPDTGATVERLTDGKGDTIFPYFTQPIFAPELDMLLLSSNRSGTWQSYALVLGEGKLVQLSDEPGGISHHGACVLPTKGAACYVTGRTLKRADLSTQKAESIYEAPEGFRVGILSPPNSGEYVAFVYSEVLRLSTETGVIYSTMKEHLFRRPACVVMRVATDGSGMEAVWGEREWISHVNMSPVDPDIVVFCHEGPWQLVQRLWAVRCSTNEVWPILKQRRYLDRSGHEYFTVSGRLVTQWSTKETPASSDRVCYNALVNPDGGDVDMYRYPGSQPSHIQTNAREDLFVGDAAYPTPDFKEGRAFMCVVRHVGDRAEVKPICRHDTSWRTQHSHPHPVFTPDDEHAVFNSDRGGRSNVYRVRAVWE